MYRQSTERLLQGGTGIVFGLEYVFKHTARGIPTHKREGSGVSEIHAREIANQRATDERWTVLVILSLYS